MQQFREGIPGEHRYGFVIHDRDRIYSRDLDSAVTAMGVKVLRTPFRSPQANAVCERLVGTIRRECLDFSIPFGERHLRRILLEWVTHDNQGRPHNEPWTGHSGTDLRSYTFGTSPTPPREQLHRTRLNRSGWIAS